MFVDPTGLEGEGLSAPDVGTAGAGYLLGRAAVVVTGSAVFGIGFGIAIAFFFWKLGDLIEINRDEPNDDDENYT